MVKKFIVIGLILFGSFSHNFFSRNTADATTTPRLLAQAYPTIDPDTYDQNGNIKGKEGYDAVWTPGVGWQHIPQGGVRISTKGLSEDESVANCTELKKATGTICTIQNAQAGCGCPDGTYCQHIGAPNPNGTQSIQCLKNPPTPTKQPTPTPRSLEENQTTENDEGNPEEKTPTCDPNGDGKIDIFDFNVWRDEYLTKTSNTAKSACFAEDKTIVDLLDFQVWKDLNFNKLPLF